MQGYYDEGVVPCKRIFNLLSLACDKTCMTCTGP